MSDIDFDELDKAVNNIVGKPSNGNDSASVKPPADNVSSPPSLSSPDESPDVKKPTGRFMDVMHPSSDMTGKNAQPTENPEPSRPKTAFHSGQKNITPLHNNISAPTGKDNTSSNAHAEPNIKSDWPDPIDAAVTHAKDDTLDDGQASPNDSEPKASAEPVDAASLFLPNTEVEKRPLGGFNSGQAGQTKPEYDKTPPLPNNEAQQSPNVSPDQEISLPPELEANLVAIEEGESPPTATPLETDSLLSQTPLEAVDEDSLRQQSPDVEEEQEPPSTGQTRMPEPALEPKPAPEEPKPEPPITPKGPTVSTIPQKAELSGLLAAGSIPQQYKTPQPPSKPEAASHPILFDADHYDQTPGAKPAKKRSRISRLFQWIFILIGLLLLGATLGGALFIFVSSN